MKKTEIRISGLGGQGVVLAGQIIGRAAAHDGKDAIQTQSYGAEARGSMAKSEVIISDDRVGFPIVRKCDILVAMSQDTLDINVKDLREDGILIVDSAYVKAIPKLKAKTFKIPATEYAEKIFGDKIYANMIMLGVLIKTAKVVSEKAIEKAIRDTITKRNVNKNKEAYEKGKSLV